jgi:ABC-type transporter Mla MlaB component
MALEHAEEIDSYVASLNQDFIKQIRALANAPDLERANHRLHHLKQLNNYA